MLQSLLRLLASEEEKSADAEQLDVSLQKLPWAQLEEKTMLVQFHSFLMKFNIRKTVESVYYHKFITKHQFQASR